MVKVLWCHVTSKSSVEAFEKALGVIVAEWDVKEIVYSQSGAVLGVGQTEHVLTAVVHYEERGAVPANVPSVGSRRSRRRWKG